MATATLTNFKPLPYFDPRTIGGCQLWLDGTDLNGNGTSVINGASVSRWVDKSGKGNNVSQTTSGNQPSFSSNGVLFDGANDFLQTSVALSSLITASTYTVFISAVNYSISSSGPSYTGPMFICDQNAWFGIFISSAAIGAYNWDGNADYASVPFTSPGSAIVTTQHTNNILSASLFGNTPATTSSGNTGNLTYVLELGRSYGGQYYTNCLINELVIYNTVLTLQEQKQIEGYLAWKWGLQTNLPTTHPFRAGPPTPFSQITLPAQIKTAKPLPYFDPRSISGCQLWLDAADPNGNGSQPANGATISIWRDKSSNRLPGTAVNSPTFQTNSLNQLPVIRFNGTNQYINFGNVLNLGTNGLSVFMVTKFSINPSNIVGMIGKSSFRANTGRWGLIYDSVSGGPNGVGIDSFIDDTNQVLAGMVFNPATQFNIFTAVNNRTTTNTVYANGTLGNQRTFSASANNLSNTDHLYVAAYPDSTGQSPQSGLYMNGDIGEILVYFSAFTISQQQQIEGYLAWKWGLQSNLPSNHPFRAGPPTPFAQLTLPVPTKGARWRPTQISGCSLWLDAADISTMTVSGTSISQWRDKSGFGRNATPSGSPTLIQSIQNRLPAIFFNGGQRFVGSLTNTTNQQSVFSVFRFNTGAPQYSRLLSFGVNQQTDFNNSAYYNLSYDTGTFLVTRHPLSSGVNLAAPILDAFHQASIIYNGTNGLFYTDGGTHSNSSVATANFNFNQYCVGSDQFPTTFQQLVGYVGEIIVYSSGVTDSQRLQVEGYLAWKWGLVANLPGNHPFKNWPPPPS